MVLYNGKSVLKALTRESAKAYIEQHPTQMQKRMAILETQEKGPERKESCE